jgi:hypothetical protein
LPKLSKQHSGGGGVRHRAYEKSRFFGFTPAATPAALFTVPHRRSRETVEKYLHSNIDGHASVANQNCHQAALAVSHRVIEDRIAARLDGFAGRFSSLEIKDLGQNHNFAPHELA